MGDFMINGVNLLSRDKKDRHALCEVMVKSSVPAWHAFKAYMDMKTTDHASVISLIKRFPFEEFTESDLNETVLPDKLIVSCEVCRSHVTNRRILYRTKTKDINFENCILLRKLAIEYEDDNWEAKTDKFILENFAEACKQTQTKFIEALRKDDILSYVRMTARSCNKFEFNAIMIWFKANTERHKLFPELVSGEGHRSLFKTSLRTLCELENETILSSISKYIRSSEQGPNWLISHDNFGFVRYLSQQPQCEFTSKQADTYILEHLSELPENADVANLPAEAIEQYASDSTFYGDHASIWMLIKNWMTQQNEMTKEQRLRILASMHITKLSYPILREYVKHEIVRESATCQANLIEVILTNAVAVEKSHMLLKKKVSDTEESLQSMTNAMTEIGDGAVKDKSYDEWKNGVNSRLTKNEESLRLCKELEKRLTLIEKHNSRISDLESRLERVEAWVNTSKQRLNQASQTADESQEEDRFNRIEKRLRNLEAMLPDDATDDEEKRRQERTQPPINQVTK